MIQILFRVVGIECHFSWW